MARKKHRYRRTVITGYTGIKWTKGKKTYYTKSLVTHREMHTYWRKDGHIKLKITKWLPMVRSNQRGSYYKPVAIGDYDYYDWQCYAIIECVTCVELDSPRFMVLDLNAI